MGLPICRIAGRRAGSRAAAMLIACLLAPGAPAASPAMDETTVAAISPVPGFPSSAGGAGTPSASAIEARREKTAAELAARDPEALRCTAGVHPHYAKSFGASTAATLRELAALPVVAAIGAITDKLMSQFRNSTSHCYAQKQDIIKTIWNSQSRFQVKIFQNV